MTTVSGVILPQLDQPLVSTIANVANALVKECIRSFPKIQGFAFDPDLSYESGLQRIRGANRYQPDVNKLKSLPALIWNRSVLRPAEGVANLQLNQSVMTKPNVEGYFNVMDGTNGQFDFEFMFITTEMSLVEQFEVLYTGRRGMTKVKSLNIGLPPEISTSPLVYNVNWEPALDSMTFSLNDNYYKVLQGKATVSGWYLAWQPSDIPGPEVQRSRLLTTLYVNGWQDHDISSGPHQDELVYSINNDPLDTNPNKISYPTVPPAPNPAIIKGFQLGQFKFTSE